MFKLSLGWLLRTAFDPRSHCGAHRPALPRRADLGRGDVPLPDGSGVWSDAAAVRAEVASLRLMER